MTIVTTRPRKRPAKPAQAATIKVPRIVQHTPKGGPAVGAVTTPGQECVEASVFEACQ
jgi:hypothetical protein